VARVVCGPERVKAGLTVWLPTLVLVAAMAPAPVWSANNHQGNGPGAAVENGGLRVFRFRRDLAGGSADESRRFNCVATFLAPGVAITAAHCLDGDETALAVICKTAADQAPSREAKVVRQVRHFTHDVTVFHVRPKELCSSGTATIAYSIGETEHFYVHIPRSIGAPREQIKHDRPASLAQLSQNAHTIDVLDDEICLATGDSGTPLLVERRLHTNVIAGLLIGGAPECSGVQTFVRLDGLREWITAQMREVRE